MQGRQVGQGQYDKSIYYNIDGLHYGVFIDVMRKFK
jgi:hypothetical protein